MMRWTSSLALLKSSDISVTTLCRPAAAYSAFCCCSLHGLAMLHDHVAAERQQRRRGKHDQRDARTATTRFQDGAPGGAAAI